MGHGDCAQEMLAGWIRALNASARAQQAAQRVMWRAVYPKGRHGCEDKTATGFALMSGALLCRQMPLFRPSRLLTE
ncbi:MAG TPA: hypothetical protein VF433_03575, partial [Cellvibrio sp.]